MSGVTLIPHKGRETKYCAMRGEDIRNLLNLFAKYTREYKLPRAKKKLEQQFI